MCNNVIRLLTTEDIPALCKLAPLFWSEGGLSRSFDPEVFSDTWHRLLSAKIGTVIGLIHDDEVVGALGFLLFPDPNDGLLNAQEMFWFVHPDHRGGGIRLLKQYEKEATSLGAKRLGMVHLTRINGEPLGRLYQRLGYNETEVHYMKEVV